MNKFQIKYDVNNRKKRHFTQHTIITEKSLPTYESYGIYQTYDSYLKSSTFYNNIFDIFFFKEGNPLFGPIARKNKYKINIITSILL